MQNFPHLETNSRTQASPLLVLWTFVPPPPPADDADNVLLIGAKTGSVKTLAYLLPFVEVLRQYPGTGVKALPLMPSRELGAGAHFLH